MKRILTALACSCAFATACNAQMTAAQKMAFGGAALPYDRELQYFSIRRLQDGSSPRFVILDSASKAYGAEVSVYGVAANSYNGYLKNGTANDFIFGSNGSATDNFFMRVRTALTWGNIGNARAIVKFMDGTITLNGSAIGSFDPALPLAQSSSALQVGDNWLSFDFYYVKVWGSDGSLIFDGIPVRKDGECFIYNKISGALIAKAGLGDVIAGPER